MIREFIGDWIDGDRIKWQCTNSSGTVLICNGREITFDPSTGTVDRPSVTDDDVSEVGEVGEVRRNPNATHISWEQSKQWKKIGLHYRVI